ncbi:hypothetical protein Taro_001168 [Colocasia esculenta]|uniref:Uncharacterized protein n=1 Tax=Colocasia esculenta TaxID=4460 RepID=A0A843T972_COLES|nr:hypothetical protein [Colocasia esculenta]
MERYLEEKKALQKRPAATFQRQDKRRTAYQSPQRPVVVSNTQVPSVRSSGYKKECPHCGRAHGGSPAWTIPSSSSSASDRTTRKASSPGSSLALESGIESEELEVPLSVHTPAGCVDTQSSCVDTTEYLSSDYFMNAMDVSTHNQLVSTQLASSHFTAYWM